MAPGDRRPIPAIVACEIDVDLARRLRRLDDDSLSCHLLLAWQIVLQRRLGASAVPMSCFISGRGFEKLQAVVGPLDVDRPLLLELHEATVAGQIEELRSTLADAQLWQQFAPRAADRADVFGFDYRPPDPLPGAERLDICELLSGGEVTRLKLQAFWQDSDRLAVRFLHDPNIYGTQDVARIASQWRHVLWQLASKATERVSDLVLDAHSSRTAERARAEHLPEVEETLLERFEGHAQRDPQRTAIVFEGGRWSYAEVNERSNRLARSLMKLGVAGEDTVAICLEPGPWIVCGMLAAHKLGASFVMVDGSWPAGRLSDVLSDSGARVVITEQLYLSKIADAEASPQLVSVDRDADEIAEEEPGNIGRRVLRGAAAYQVFTSGSTGRPKGVVVSHRALSHYVCGLLAALSVGDEPLEWLSLAAMSADLGYTTLFGALWSGGSIRLMPAASSLDAQALARSLEDRPVDVLKIVPGHLSALLTVSNAARLLPQRYLVCGGEELPRSLVEEVWALSPRLRIFNHYGPSETTVGALCGEVSRADLQYARISIGRPLNYREAYVLDARLRLAGVGVIGELYLGGEGLADGYRGRAGHTAERFIPHPWRNGARLYKTGDLARQRSDGRIEFLGRSDHQIKRRGHRIELGEIEQVLMRHGHIRQAVVLWSQQRLLGYVIADLSSEELEAYAESSLIEVMRPTHWVRLQGFPSLANGKVDRQALLSIETEQSQRAEIAAARTQTESLLVSLWQQLLRVERIGIHDNFFRLGGDSIIVIQLVARAREHGLRLSPAQVFEYPTVAQLAQVGEHENTTQISQAAVEGEMGLAPRQLRFVECYGSDACDYHRIRVLEVHRVLDRHHLESAVRALVAHHDSLRLRFVPGQQWMQYFAPVDQIDVRSIVNYDSLDADTGAQLQAELHRVIGEHRWPDLQSSLFKVIYLERPGAGGRLVLLAHPLIIDGVSWRFLQDDLIGGYRQLQQGASLELPLKTHSYKEWLRHLQQQRLTEFESQIDYWAEVAQMRGAVPPADHEGVRGPAALDTLRVHLPPAVTRRLLQESNAAYNTEVTDLLAASLWLALFDWTRGERFVVEMEWHGREEQRELDVSRTVGWFASLHPVALECAANAGVADVIKQVKEQLRAVPDNGSGYGVLRYLHPDAQVRERLSPLDPPAIFFTHLGQLDQQLQQTQPLSPGELIGGALNRRQRSIHSIEIHTALSDQQLLLECRYDGRKYEASTIERFVARYAHYIEMMVAHCADPAHGGFTPSDFPMAGLEQAQLDTLVASVLSAGESKADLVDIYPLTKMQQGMLSRSLIAPNSGVYVIQHAVELRGPLDAEALQWAWREVMHRHDVFRTQFWGLGSDRPLQIVKLTAPLPWRAYDWSDLSEAEQSQRFDQLLHATSCQDYDYAKAPLMRLSLVRLSAEHHRFIWDNHHVLADGWSSGVIWQEVMQLYRAKVDGVPAGLPLVSSRYRDYVRWLAQRDNTASERFWKEYLSGVAVTPLPFEGLDGIQTNTGRSEQHSVVLDASLTEQLKALAREQAVTLNTVLQAAWMLLLSVYTGRDEVTIGATISGRPPQLNDIERIVGVFLNTIPVRAEISKQATLADWLQSLHANSIACEPHSYFPLADIQRVCGCNDAQGLFNTLIVFDNQPREDADRHAGLKVSRIDEASSYNHYPLSLIVVPERQLQLAFKYHADFFTTTRIAQMGEQLVELLRQMPWQANRQLAALEYLSVAQREQVMAWSGQGESLQRVETLLERVEEHAKRDSERAAVVFAGGQWSYGELNRRANQLARYLMKLGVASEETVAICVEPGPWMVCGMLAAHKLGASFVMVDATWPIGRLCEVLADSNARAVITEQLHLSKVSDAAASAQLVDRDAHEFTEAAASTQLVSVDRDAYKNAEAGTSSQIVSVDRDADEIAEEDAGNIGRPMVPGAAAYQVYTSGSTGRPKGVVISHRALSHYVGGLLAELSVDDEPLEWLSLAAMSADLGYTTMFGGLWTGGTIRLMPAASSLDAQALARALEDRPVDVLKIVPGHLAALLTVANAARLLPQRYLLCGGEEFPKSLVEEVWALSPQLRILNHYGPSETTVGALCGEVTRADLAYKRVSIGRPLKYREAYVLDAQMRLVGAGVIGELYLGGEGLADGYRGRGGQTAERFLPHPWRSGARLYKTGDLARHRADGRIEFLGRADHQIKRRGYRIELGEIEQVLTRHPRIRQAVVLWSQERLLGYVITELPTEELEAYTQSSLIEVMRPTHWIRLQSYPLLANGKVDRQALLSLQIEKSQRPELAAARTQTESLLVTLWQQLLKVDRIGIHDNFFRLGGDSIIVIQLVARARERGVKLSPAQLFEYPTIAQLAQVGEHEDTTQISQAAVEGEMPLAPRQRWFMERYEQDACHHHRTRVLQVNGVLNREHLESAVRALVTHHDALRLRFISTASGADSVGDATSGGSWVQHFAPVDQIDVGSIIDYQEMTAVADEQLQAKLHQVLAAHRWPDLKSGLFKAMYFERPGLSGRLVLLAHPLIIDGVSWRFLQDDLIGAYQQIQQGDSLTLPLKTHSYRDWVDYLASKRLAALEPQIDHWAEVAQAIGTVPPADLEESGNVPATGSVWKHLPTSLTRRLLQQTNAAYNTEVRDLLAASLWLALHEWTRGERFVVDMEWHGREEQDDLDVSRTVGWFASLHPVVLESVGNGGVASVIKQVKEQLRSVPHKGTGYSVLRYLHPDAQVREQLTPVQAPAIFFTYLGQLDQQLSARGVFARGQQLGSFAGPTQAYALELHVSISDQKLLLDCRYEGRRYDTSTIERFVARYAHYIEMMVAHCADPTHGGFTPSDFPMAGLEQAQLDTLVASVLSAGESKADLVDIYPLTKMQQGMLSRSLIAPNSGVYVIQHAVELRGTLDAEALQWAWREVMHRHDVFRTQFWGLGSDRPLQIVKLTAPLPWRAYDWSDLSEAEQSRLFDQLLHATSCQDYDYAKAPLMRLSLVRLSAEHHRFIWDNHHVLADGWSSGVIWQEVMQLYRAKVDGVPAGLPLVSSRYRDYVRWLAQRDNTASERFWKEYLSGVAVTPLPFEGLDGIQTNTGRSEQHSVVLDVSLTEQLKALAREQAVTLNTVLQAAWMLLLSVYTGRDEVTIGATISGRPPQLSDIERMVGVFLNTIPVRAEISKQATLADWLQSLHANSIACEPHSYFPLADIQRVCGCNDAQGLFNTLIVFDNQPREDADRYAGVEVARIEESSSYNHYPLSLIVVPRRCLRLAFKYHADAFTAARIKQIGEQLIELLRQMPRQAAQRLGAFEYLSKAQREQVMTWSGQGASLQNVQTLLQRVERHAGENPQRTAVAFAGGEWSYRALNERSNQLARYLMKLGVASEETVAICVEPGPWMVCGMLAAHKLGASFVMVDATWPIGRLCEVLADSNARAVITEQLHLSKVSDAAASTQIVSVDRDADEIAEEDAGNIGRPMVSGAAAYQVYTSGSTGRPKGVVISHRALSHYVCGLLAELSVGDEPLEWLSLAAMSADLGYTAIFGALWTGGSIRQMPAASSLDAQALARALEDRPVDVLKIVPGHLAALLTVANAARLLPQRYLLCGGEEFPKSLVEEVWALSPQLRIFNHYGPSETTVGALCGEVTRADLAYKRVSIGRPLKYREAYVLDAQMHLVGAGVIGELYLGGEGLADGYRGRGGQTAERFLPHPWRSGARLYKTGDLARHRADGRIEFLGRADHQIKRRGYRIELGEIEQVLMRHPGIRQAVVLWSQERLLGYVITEMPTEELEAYAQSSLIEVMRPTHWIRLQSYPLLANGKVDRQALLSLQIEKSQRPELAAARTQTESLLVTLWQQLLKVDRIGIHDNFFRLGGDSIIVIQLVARARERGVKLSPAQLFEYPTIAQLARVATRQQSISAEQGLVTGESRLIPIQRRFFESVTVAPEHYHQSAIYEVHGTLDEQLLLGITSTLLRHHDALRSVFVIQDGEVRQRFLSYDEGLARQSLVIAAYDPGSERNEQLASQLQTMQRSFNLAHGPLFRILWQRDAESRHRLAFVCHHLIVDAVSWHILLEDFTQLYRLMLAGEQAELPAKTCSYLEWSRWLHADAGAGRWDTQREYWERLARHHPKAFVQDRDDGNTEGNSKKYTTRLSAAHTAALLTEVHHAYNTEVSDLLLGALLIAVNETFGGDSLLLDLESHGREDLDSSVDLSRTVGWFTTIYPVLLRMPRDAGAAPIIRSVKEELRAIPNHGFGYGMLRYLGDEAVRTALGAAPRSQLRFNYFGRFDGDSAGLLERVSTVCGRNRNEQQDRQYLFKINAIVSRGILATTWEYSSGQFDEATVVILANRYESALERLVDHCRGEAAQSFSPSDFPELDMEQAELNEFLDELDKVVVLQ
ncbi:amino acid adenylation domain-containing protein [Steroidobacter sp. S1-65]|uniref:Amino acid adenylation domain-containing protein n=1 Tax=Steroidobacter gossypii TaxID=2805490 RepID=A0ABS1WZX5_9GAMM|nr:non-ribosomal peptide synthetase [Steroidobacter gossypii]MBM0106535.1 amino acid adenylation domain-containing protein [Steroidobacter gossypii]